MKRKLIITFTALLALIAIQSQASAVARHDRVDVKEYTEKGEKGVKITLTLHAETYERARVGIAPAGVAAPGGDHRKAASDPKVGHLLHQFTEQKLTPNDSTKVELKVLYKNAPNLKPGMEFEIVSAFNASSNKEYWHVFGMTGAGGTPDKYKVGKPEAAARKANIKKVVRKAGRKVAKSSSKRRRSRVTTAQKNRAKAKNKNKSRVKSSRARAR